MAVGHVASAKGWPFFGILIVIIIGGLSIVQRGVGGVIVCIGVCVGVIVCIGVWVGVIVCISWVAITSFRGRHSWWIYIAG